MQVEVFYGLSWSHHERLLKCLVVPTDIKISYHSLSVTFVLWHCETCKRAFLLHKHLGSERLTCLPTAEYTLNTTISQKLLKFVYFCKYYSSLPLCIFSINFNIYT
jgi:hypothetical protein